MICIRHLMYTASHLILMNTIMRYLIYIFLFCSSLVFADSPNSFTQSKKIVRQLFQSHPKTIYCGCSFNDKTVDLNSCGMQAAINKKRAHRTEVEHILRRFGNML